MLPIVNIPEAIRKGLKAYRTLFCREAGFGHVCRFITGLIVSPNKRLQGIYALQVWPADQSPGRRAMHESVFESGWQSEALMPHHRKIVSQHYRGQSRSVTGFDWTLNHHEWGPGIFGIRKGHDYIRERYGRFQTVLTGVVFQIWTSNQNAKLIAVDKKPDHNIMHAFEFGKTDGFSSQSLMRVRKVRCFGSIFWVFRACKNFCVNGH